MGVRKVSRPGYRRAQDEIGVGDNLELEPPPTKTVAFRQRLKPRLILDGSRRG
jgi:hypothetical protein